MQTRPLESISFVYKLSNVRSEGLKVLVISIQALHYWYVLDIVLLNLSRQRCMAAMVRREVSDD